MLLNLIKLKTFQKLFLDRDIDMNDVIVIDTSAGLTKPKQTPKYCDVFSENFFLLHERMSDYLGLLPNEEINTIAYHMINTMLNISAFGLSANQCGYRLRMLVYGTKEAQFACINPEVIEQSQETTKGYEFNPSFPGLKLKIERPKWVKVEYLTLNGELVDIKLEDTAARCFLHQLDLLNGIPFTKRVGQTALKIGREHQRKRLRGLDAGRMTKSLTLNYNL